MEFKQTKREIFEEHIHGVGGFSAIKTFVCVVGHRFVGDKIISIKKKQLGREKFYLRTWTCDLHLANSMLGKKDGDYNFLLSRTELQYANVIIDAGANIGFFTRLCRNVNKKAVIVAVELEKENYDMLIKNTHGCDVKTLHKGLWNHSAKLRVIDRNTGAVGFSAKEMDSTTIDYDVDAISVPDIMSLYEIDSIDIFKIDIEGAEYYLFDATSDKWIDKVNMFIIELHDRIIEGSSERVIHALTKHGFSYEIYGENYIFTRKI